MDRLTLMATFVRSVELGSFSAVADELNLSPQLVGKQVKMLEQHLGVSLLNRTTRKQSLTDFGRTFYERAKLILADVDAAEEMAAVTRGVPSGRLRINAPVTFGVSTLSPRLLEYMVRFPQVSVDLTLSNELVDLVEGGYDAVFRIGELADSGMKALPLKPYPMVLCAAPAYLARRPAIATPQDLQTHECLAFAYSDGRSHIRLEGPEGVVDVPIKSRLTINQGDPLLAAAVAGLGVVMLPLELVKDALRAGTLVRVLTPYEMPVSPMNLLYAPDRRLTPKLQSFMDFARAAFGPQA
ncbi:LysR family transcriptional regulator [Pseudomonas sp. COR58]|uniref:LysR family transcriptional regulator n=1 Tax=Pseudomonas ekonensis TaxID=2842353 RepID=A0ABS6PES3_9PSED|nr:LysR family transcriptional regulator [Pseudomonas ekonensis]MBV4458486.1 LysR family transcriptional regulator [Pseudomonas ekonensis]